MTTKRWIFTFKSHIYTKVLNKFTGYFVKFSEKKVSAVTWNFLPRLKNVGIFIDVSFQPKSCQISRVFNAFLIAFFTT